MNAYVMDIEPRLTAHRTVTPTSTTDVLVEFAKDLDAELGERLRRIDSDQLQWRPHEDANSAGVTAWHVARWLDVLGTRIFTGAPKDAEVWHRDGWAGLTDYDPAGVGYLGLGTLTGYTPDEMRAVPSLDADSLERYLHSATDALVQQLRLLADGICRPLPGLDLSPYQLVGSTLQGSFGHVGEIDALVFLQLRGGAHT